MNDAPDLAGMQLLLRQGRAPALLSLGLLLVAVLLLGMAPGRTVIATGLLLASVSAGLAQAYYALRTGLDASLLRLLRKEGLDGDAAARRVDQVLQDAGLRRQRPGAPLRDWGARWAGMRRLLLRQYAAGLLQVALLLLSVLWPQA
ncbi:hypothetical protein [[Pseudomonas] boreopolis]|uniref:Transmembrane protein n=1 Tax=Xanthomonas boreopolis TaxID=86183 RepID=A0A919F7J8_9XANT|nr:hypothetical protein GCM10009090_18460 [[Pseudomonas] boreopolis]